jgi:nucleoside phosphorylase
VIFIVTALHCEAKPLIDHFDLKKDQVSQKFDLFQNDRIALIVSGIGKIRSAIATTYLLTNRDSSEISAVLNIGVCGSAKDRKLGDLFNINKITDHAGGRQYFPEPVLQLGMQEASVETFDKPVESSHAINFESDLVDMEASGFFQAASMFTETHRIYCFKIVSDLLELSHISKDFISGLIKERIPEVERIFTMLSDFHAPVPDLIGNDDRVLITKIGSNLKLTQSQSHQLADLIRSAKVRKKYEVTKLIPFTTLEIKTKNDNKNAFNRIRQILGS